MNGIGRLFIHWKRDGNSGALFAGFGRKWQPSIGRHFRSFLGSDGPSSGDGHSEKMAPIVRRCRCDRSLELKAVNHGGFQADSRRILRGFLADSWGVGLNLWPMSLLEGVNET